MHILPTATTAVEQLAAAETFRRSGFATNTALADTLLILADPHATREAKQPRTQLTSQESKGH